MDMKNPSYWLEESAEPRETFGPVTVELPRDRDASFEPRISQSGTPVAASAPALALGVSQQLNQCGPGRATRTPLQSLPTKGDPAPL